MEPGELPVGNRLRPETKRYWIKCTIALQILADALRPIVDKTIRDYHQSQPLFTEECDHTGNDQVIYRRCTDGRPQRHQHKGNCPCHDNGVRYHLIRRNLGKWVFEGCDQCQEAFGQLKGLFVDPTPDKMHWDNVNIQNVFSNHWEIAKLFMPRGNYGTDTPEQADAGALLTVVKTCNLFQNRIDHRLADMLKSKVVVTELCDVAIEENIQGLMKNIKERLANGEDARDLMKRLESGNDDGVTAEMNDEEIERDIENLLSEIKDRLANNEDAMDLMDRLRIATPRSPSVRAYFFLGPYQM